MNFLAKQAEATSSESEEEYTTVPERLTHDERAGDVAPDGGEGRSSEAENGSMIGTRDCARCHGTQMEVKCMVCKISECSFCLQEGRGWSARVLKLHAWVCSLCAGKEYAEIFDDEIFMYYLKTSKLPLGLAADERAKVKRVGKRYRWDSEMQMFKKAAGKLRGERIIPEPAERDAIVKDLHKFGHLGMARVADAIVNQYFWVGMHKDVKRIVNACPCATSKRKVTVVRPLLPTLILVGPFDLVAVDLMTLARSYEGNRYLIVAQDYFSKWPEVKPVPEKTAKAVADFLEEYVFARYGCPVELVTDQGREFLGEVNQVLTRVVVIHQTTSAYRAQANGLVEHLNGVLGRALSATLDKGDLRTSASDG